MYSANVDHGPHDGRHTQGCVSCYAYVEAAERRAEFDALLVGPPTTGGLIRHRARRPGAVRRALRLLGLARP